MKKYRGTIEGGICVRRVENFREQVSFVRTSELNEEKRSIKFGVRSSEFGIFRISPI